MKISELVQKYGLAVTATIPPEAILANGDVFFVDSTATNTLDAADGEHGNSWDQPFATLDYAIGRCTASNGDVLLVSPFHAETVTSAITLDVAGVSILGLSIGRQMPTITGNGEINALAISGAGCKVSGLKFAAPETDGQYSDIAITGANCAVLNTLHIGSKTAKNKVTFIGVSAGANDCLIDGSKFYNSVVEVSTGLTVDGAVARLEIRNCSWHCAAFGFTAGAFFLSAIATDMYIHDNVFSNSKAATAVINLTANATGIFARNFISGRHTTIASNIVTGTSTDWFENYVTEEPLKNGLLMPAVDAD